MQITSTVFGALACVGAVAALDGVLLGKVPLPAGAVCAVMCGGFGAMMLRNALAMRRPTELARTGVAAVATLEEVLGSGVSIRVKNSAMEGNVSQTRMRMRIDAPGKTPYTVEVTDFLPTEAYGRLVPGTRFAAHVDPARPARVLVDWSAQG